MEKTMKVTEVTVTSVATNIVLVLIVDEVVAVAMGVLVLVVDEEVAGGYGAGSGRGRGGSYGRHGDGGEDDRRGDDDGGRHGGKRERCEDDRCRPYDDHERYYDERYVDDCRGGRRKRYEYEYSARAPRVYYADPLMHQPSVDLMHLQQPYNAPNRVLGMLQAPPMP